MLTRESDYMLLFCAFGMHRLVQAVTVDQMPAELAVAWRQATAAVIEAAIPEDPNEPDTWPSTG